MFSTIVMFIDFTICFYGENIVEKIINFFNRIITFLIDILEAIFKPIEGLLNVFSTPAVGISIITLVFIGMLILCVFRNWKQFLDHVKYTKTILICVILILLNIMLGHETVTINNAYSFNFGFITLPIISTLFGPLAGCLCGIIQDIMSSFINSGGQNYHFLYTLCAGISGIILGLMRYRKKVTMAKLLVTSITVIIVVDIFLNTIAISSVTGKSMYSILPPIILSGIIQIPVHTLVNYCILKIVEKIKI